ncbi:unnamed protein product [Echinostoma caproni]|uniref:Transmembrane protein n=1 Tax=Echinostoma caproni TaxID=27848 RepID=A0A183ADJ0_9TREM|nr:unnamed protein product [Echinostoma caproni]
MDPYSLAHPRPWCIAWESVEKKKVFGARKQHCSQSINRPTKTQRETNLVEWVWICVAAFVSMRFIVRWGDNGGGGDGVVRFSIPDAFVFRCFSSTPSK